MQSEAFIRISIFLGLFVILAIAETVRPRKMRNLPRRGRWFVNMSVTVLDTISLWVLALALPLLAIGAAIDAATKGWGLFNLLTLPNWLAIILTILILDFCIWFQHFVSHKIPLLWRFHRVHHSDRDIDVTTAIRFHPVEIFLSMLFKIGLVYILGAPPLGVLLFELLLNGAAMFNHANLNLPPKLDRMLRYVLVTPDMHRVHHSVYRDEHDSNYGFSLSFWDRLLGTYIAQPKDGHDKMTIGLEWQDNRPARLGWVLRLPFLK